MSGQTIVVLGGGIGGIAAARTLRKKIGKQHQVIVIDRSDTHHFQPSYLWVIAEQRFIEDISRPLRKLSKRGIQFIQDDVLGIDTERKLVRAEKGDIPYDHLVISLGAELAPGTIPGSEGHNIYNLYDFNVLSKIHRAIIELKRGHLVILVCSTPFKCPAAPYEAALLMRDLTHRNNAHAVKVSVYTPEALPMPTAGPAIGSAVKAMLAEQDITYNPKRKVTKFDLGTKEIVFEDDTRVGYDCVLMVPPHRAPSALEGSGLLGESGWIPVHPHTMETQVKNVYAIGDITGIKLNDTLSLPKAGVFAEKQAIVVAENIAAKVAGRPPTSSFDGHGACFLEIGRGKAGYASGDFYHKPEPDVKMRPPARVWHWTKGAFESYWFFRWFGPF